MKRIRREPLICDQTTHSSGKRITQLFNSLSKEYEGRLAHYSGLSSKSSGLETQIHLRTDSEREGGVILILKKIQSSDELVLLDERGKEHGRGFLN